MCISFSIIEEFRSSANPKDYLIINEILPKVAVPIWRARGLHEVSKIVYDILSRMFSQDASKELIDEIYAIVRQDAHTLGEMRLLGVISPILGVLRKNHDKDNKQEVFESYFVSDEVKLKLIKLTSDCSNEEKIAKILKSIWKFKLDISLRNILNTLNKDIDDIYKKINADIEQKVLPSKVTRLLSALFHLVDGYPTDVTSNFWNIQQLGIRSLFREQKSLLIPFEMQVITAYKEAPALYLSAVKDELEQLGYPFPVFEETAAPNWEEGKARWCVKEDHGCRLPELFPDYTVCRKKKEK